MSISRADREVVEVEKIVDGQCEALRSVRIASCEKSLREAIEE